jgi:hypothetical protein
MKTTKQPLAKFRHIQQTPIVKLEGLKMIVRFDFPRKREYWLVLPAIGDGDAVCVFIRKFPRWELLHYCNLSVLEGYKDRITEILCSHPKDFLSAK